MRRAVMGFKDARAAVIAALRNKQLRHEGRSDIEQKNLLYNGAVTADFVADLLLRCAAWEYSTSKHYFLEVDCHIFTPVVGGQQWYIKAYLESGNAVFISVHP
jgi:hypothetical protein